MLPHILSWEVQWNFLLPSPLQRPGGNVWVGRTGKGGGKDRPLACPETCGVWEGFALTTERNKRVQGKGEAKLIRKEMFKSTAAGN